MRSHGGESGGQPPPSGPLLHGDEGPPSAPAVPVPHAAHASAANEPSVQGAACKRRCMKCVASQKLLGMLGEGEDFVRFVGTLCKLMTTNPSSSTTSPLSHRSFSFSSSSVFSFSLLVHLVDGRVVEGELLGVDTSSNLILKDVKERIFLPWPSIDSISSEREDEGSERNETGGAAREKGLDPSAQVYVQLVERARQHIVIRSSQIASISLSSRMFKEALAQAKTKPAFVLL
ncbi:hypothetical protein Esti_002152 [Eimeria stiedai]